MSTEELSIEVAQVSANEALDTLKNRRTFAFDVEGEQAIDDWSIHECLYCEREGDGTTFLLSGGTRYRVDKDFVGSVNRAVKRLLRATPGYENTPFALTAKLLLRYPTRA